MEPEQISMYIDNQVDSNFVGDINNMANQTKDLSTIKKVSNTTENVSLKNTDNILDKDLKNNRLKKLPYPDYVNEVPEIKIRDEDNLVSGEKIQLYDRYTDQKFNICKTCSKNENFYYCRICNKNFCKKCICKCDKQQLIDLEEMKKEAEKKKQDIKNIMIKYNVIPKEIEKNPNLKRNKADGFTEDNFDDENYDNKKLFSNNDIKLIEAILENDYKNYFHFQNINRCYDYLENVYDGVYDKDCMKIEYEIDNNENKETEYIIFCKDFVEENKNIISLIINGKKSPLVEKATISENYLDVIVIQNLKEEYLKNMSYMFCSCNFKSITFKEVKMRNKLNLSHVTDISNMFKDCSNLHEVDLEWFGVMKLKNMEALFSGCKELTNILNIGKLNTSLVTNFDRIFNLCKNLKNSEDLEPISNFKTGHGESFVEMFKGCSSLVPLPNISNWDMKNAKDLRGMFKNCKNLTVLPDISEWNVENVESMEEMFSGCERLRLKSLHDFKKWNLKKLRVINKIFFGCQFISKCNELYGRNPQIEDFFKFANTNRIFRENIFDSN